jgi:hypothetical protein
MRLHDTYLDLHTVANMIDGRTMVGWRRRIEVREDWVSVSVLAPPEEAGIGIGEPGPEVRIQCKPEQGPTGPVDRDGWLILDRLVPNHVYWLELRAFGGISIEREDDDPDYVWYWSLPPSLWEKVKCG